jgi:hypothetical protein
MKTIIHDMKGLKMIIENPNVFIKFKSVDMKSQNVENAIIDMVYVREVFYFMYYMMYLCVFMYILYHCLYMCLHHLDIKQTYLKTKIRYYKKKRMVLQNMYINKNNNSKHEEDCVVAYSV